MVKLLINFGNELGFLEHLDRGAVLGFCRMEYVSGAYTV